MLWCGGLERGAEALPSRAALRLAAPALETALIGLTDSIVLGLQQHERRVPQQALDLPLSRLLHPKV
jgi:hypothetical protein